MLKLFSICPLATVRITGTLHLLVVRAALQLPEIGMGVDDI